MAIFALYAIVAGRADLLLQLGMAVLTIFLTLIFYLKGFPLAFIRLPIPSIHVPLFVDSKILGHYEDPGD
jgi:hypothetical protein